MRESGRAREIGQRIDRTAVNADLEVQMGPRTPARLADETDALPVGDPLAFIDREARQVCVRGGEPTAVVDERDIPVRSERGDQQSLAGRGLHDG
jgi:hypothetical protein